MVKKKKRTREIISINLDICPGFILSCGEHNPYGTVWIHRGTSQKFPEILDGVNFRKYGFRFNTKKGVNRYKRIQLMMKLYVEKHMKKEGETCID